MAAEDPMKYLRVDPAQLMKEQAKTFDAKKWVWVATLATEVDGYVAAEVKSASGDMVSVETEKGKVCKIIFLFYFLLMIHLIHSG